MQYTLTIRKAAALGNGNRQPGELLATIVHEGPDVRGWLEQTVRAALRRDLNPAEDLREAVSLAEGARWEEITMAALNPQAVRYGPLGGPPAAESTEKTEEPIEEPPQEVAAETPAKDDRPDVRAFLESQTKAQLLDLAAEEEIELDGKLTKAEMIEQMMLAYESEESTD